MFKGGLVVTGGRPGPINGGLTTVERYDPRRDRWSKLPDLRTARSGHATLTVGGRRGGRIVVFGGEELGPGGTTIEQVELFDPREGGWMALPDMVTPRHGVGGATKGDRVYALEGGPQPGLAYSPALEYLDLPLSGSAVGQLARLTLAGEPASAVFGDAYHSSTNGPDRGRVDAARRSAGAPGAERERHLEVGVLDHGELVVAVLEDLVELLLDRLPIGRREAVGPADDRTVLEQVDGLAERRRLGVEAGPPRAGSGCGRRRTAGWSRSRRR